MSDISMIINESPVSKLDGRSLVFVGMMGCGKTAIGRMVANVFNLPFHDADEEIEAAAGMSVADFFATYGEAEFREGERKVIARLLSQDQCVLALGGGAFLLDATRNCISENAISIWLRADLEILHARVMRRPGKRPLLQSGNPKTILGDLLVEREPFYSQADITVDTSTTSKNVTCDWVVEAISSYLSNEKRQ